MISALRSVAFLGLALVASCHAPVGAIRTPPTVAEASGYTRTATSAEVETMLATLAARSPLIHLDSIGVTNEGRNIPLAVIADPPVRSAREARNDERLTVLLLGNIHAGEVCGKEALLALARELTSAPGTHPLLDDLIVCLIPNYNPDGNDRFSPDNRPGQCGPHEMGTRHNAQNLDLNRDYVKAEAPETRALIRFLSEWDPAITIDTHTTNGSLHRYTLTYQGPKHPSTDAPMLEYVRDVMLPDVDRAFENTTPYKSFFYGNFWKDHTLWVTYPAEPRYGVVYRGMRNRLSFLSEAYAYATFADRVLATEAFCLAVMEYGARHRSDIRALLRKADERTIEAGRSGAPIHLRNEARPFPQPVTVLGYVPEADGPDAAEKDYECLFVNDFAPTLTVARPAAYAIPPSQTRVLELLGVHAIESRTLDAPTEANISVYTIDSFERKEGGFSGATVIAGVQATPHRDRRTLPAGTIIVPTDQPLGTLASFLLEPQATDGVTAYALVPLAPGAEFPILRIERAPR